MRIRTFVCGLAAALSIGSVVNAETIPANPKLIPTNFGNGADAEIREEQTNAGGFGGTLHRGNNRGNNSELATRVTRKNADGTFTPLQTSAQYMKFDISQLPVSSDPYWNDHKVWFRFYSRNNEQFRAWDEEAGAGIPLTEFKYRLRALDPNGTYSTAQTDQFGNAYTASFYQYDWVEGAGEQGALDPDPGAPTGITAFNAPGRKVYCATTTCASANGNSIGLYDEFDLDPNVLDLGLIRMPDFDLPGVGNRLPQRYPLVYDDPDGLLTQLVMDARDAGRTTITLIAHSGVDATNYTTQPFNFLNGLNQLIAPKEQTTIVAAEPGDNLSGRYSPQLVVFVPEPASMVFVGLGCVAALAIRRRK